MKKIISIVGARPNFMKIAPIHFEFLKYKDSVQHLICHTGQHYDEKMSKIFFDELNISKPDFYLGVGSASHAVQTAGIMIEFEKVLIAENPDLVIVVGDVNSTIACSLVAKKMNIPVAHVEAGLRSFDRTMPEEINRILTDRIANTNYCCTEKNYLTLLAEGYGTSISCNVKLTGDLMYDAFLKIPFAENKTEVTEKNYVATTIHRAANILSKDKLAAIINGLNNIHKQICVVMPLHPHTRKRITEYGLKPEFQILNPLGYPAMKTFLSNSSYVVTDSGGAAREAFFCKKRSLIVMDHPFWPEIIEADCSTNVSADSLLLYESFFKLPLLCPDFGKPIFGNGNATQLIKDDILHFQN